MSKKEWFYNLKSNLKTRRKKLGLSQQDVAEKSRLSIGTIARIEQGVFENLTFDTVEALGKALKEKDSLDLLRKK